MKPRTHAVSVIAALLAAGVLAFAWALMAGEMPIGPGEVYLQCRAGDGEILRVPIAESTPCLSDARLPEFVLPSAALSRGSLTFNMFVARSRDGAIVAIPFGQRFVVTFK